jgi:hypothetical protein
MVRQMNEAQKYLVSSAYGEFLPEALRDGEHFVEIDEIVRNPSPSAPTDRMFVLLWKELDETVSLDESLTALIGLTFEINAIAAGLEAEMSKSAGA